MHLVLVSSLVPVENPACGFDIANRAVLDGLLELGHQVSVIGYLRPGQIAAGGADTHLLGTMEVSNAMAGPLRKLSWLSTALVKGKSLSSAKMLKVSQARVEALLESLAPFDGLILNSVQLPAAFADVFAGYPSIYVAHNIEADTALENAARAKNAVTRWLYNREAAYLTQYEKALSQNASWIWTFSEADRFGFGYTVSDRATCLPLVTTWDGPDTPLDYASGHDLGLIGTWSWEPNRIGLDWFLEQVVPLLPPTLSIAIAGRLPGPRVSTHPGVRFVGRVDDARAFIAASKVVPLVSRGGTGVQLKSLEAFELGLPCVATTSSLRGIFTLPANCRVADDPASFAKALVEMVGDGQGAGRDRTAGALFHKAQKTALLSGLKTGLANLGKSPQQSGNTPLLPPVPKAPPIRPAFAVHSGGKSR